MSSVRFERVTRRYGKAAALDGVDLAVRSGSFTVLSGPPRAGKSVLLRLLVGLERPDQGRILIDGRDVTGLGPSRRPVGYVPQSFALFPHMNVRDNLVYPLRQRGTPSAEIDRKLAPVAEMLRITPLLGQRPSELSGGQKQRAAVARGMLQEAAVFALDDPLVGLDFKLRESLMDELRDMQETLGATFLYATSDPLESLTLAEDLVLVDGGRLVDAGPVARLYHEPGRLRGAELTGFPRCNVLPGHVADGVCDTALGRFAVAPGAVPGGTVAVALRPEHVVGREAGSGAPPTGGVGRVRLLENLGAECVIHLDLEGGGAPVALVGVLPADDVAGLSAGDPFPFRVAPERLMLFDPGDGTRLGVGQVLIHA